ncbi:MAG TPA: hypothetical protein VMD59_21175, partial [Acidimicrobiales bacterium]|nr:hypothetical protein [Acidimicrobiales bacterium]
MPIAKPRPAPAPAVPASTTLASPAVRHGGTASTRHRPHRITPNLFGIAFGLAGLAEAWRAAGQVLGIPRAVPDTIDLASSLVWATLVVAYLQQGRRQVSADLRDDVLAPFVSLAPITAMLLSSALAAVAFSAGQILVAVFLVLTLLLGGWLTGHWMLGELDQKAAHPGYFLPTVAGGLVGAFSAAQVHLEAVGEASLGIGLICWALLGSLVLNRLFFGPRLPPRLLPTMAIELAPPAVAGLAWSALRGGPAGPVAAFFGGYAVLMGLVQLRLVPLYRRLQFTPSFWAFAFSYAAAATDALEWIGH